MLSVNTAYTVTLQPAPQYRRVVVRECVIGWFPTPSCRLYLHFGVTVKMGLAAEVYAEQLLSKAHGLPLWIPEPSKFGEVLIGDVGYVYDGSFYRLFNVTFPQDHPVNNGGVPEDFEVLEFDSRLLHRVEQYLPAGAICSKSVKRVDVAARGSSNTIDAGLGYRFSCAHDQGALLVLKAPASQEVVHPNRAFRDYMRNHHDSWYSFASARGLEIQPDRIILVRGWVKTTDWAVAAFTDSGQNHEVELDVQAGPFAKASFSVSYSSEISMSVEHRTGPVRQVKEPGWHTDAEATDTIQDQCVFLSYYEMRTRGFWAKRKIKAAAEPVDDFDEKPPDCDTLCDSDSERTSDESDVEEDRPRPKFVDPVGDLLTYILQNSDAEAAVASDDDLCRLLKDCDWPRDISEFLEAIRPRIVVDQSSTGYLAQDYSFSQQDQDDRSDASAPQSSSLPANFTESTISPLSTRERSSSFDSTALNSAVVMPTPRGKGGDPPQEGEEQTQEPVALRDPTPSPPTSPSEPPRIRMRRAMYVPGWSIPPKVLLVDDDAVCRKLSSKFLQVFGCFTDIAVDGVGAVNKMNLGKYDLVLMDIVMPKLDGMSATSQIRQFDPMTPIISMTSNSQPNEVVKYYSSGMNDILPKPFTKDDLLQKLEKHLIHLKAVRAQALRKLSETPSSHPSSPLIGNTDQLGALGAPAGPVSVNPKRLRDDETGREIKRLRLESAQT